MNVLTRFLLALLYSVSEGRMPARIAQSAVDEALRLSEAAGLHDAAAMCWSAEMYIKELSGSPEPDCAPAGQPAAARG